MDKEKNVKPRKKKTVDVEEIQKSIESKITSNDDFNEVKKTYSLFEVIILVLIFSLIFLLLGYFAKSKPKEVVNENIEIAPEIQDFINQYNYVLENYYGEIDKKELITSAIKGMLESLDEHSEFIDTESNSFSITLEGSYEGVGIGVNNQNGNIVISKIYENTPAEEVGLKEGDIVLKINDDSLENKKSTDLVNLISQYDNFTLTILRGEEELTFELSKKRIILDSVSYEMRENKIGYISVSIFANNTYEQFKKALESLENDGMKSLIIDLRGNTGGHLTAVEQMLYLFLDSSHIIYQTETNDEKEVVYSKGNVTKEYPVVILQNSLSASASEIMASALREEYGAYIIGTTSYGKGSVQQLKNVTGIGQYKFTTKRWLTPKGNWINGVGIVPDKEVQLTEEYLKNPTLENDAQYQEAIKYLK